MSFLIVIYFRWEYKKVHENFVTANTGIFANMLIYMAMTFFTSIVAATLPVPTGVLIPAFKARQGFGAKKTFYTGVQARVVVQEPTIHTR